MPPPFTSIGPFSTQTYTLLLAIGILGGIAIGVVYRRWRSGSSAGAVVDVCIAGLIGGVILARVFHVALNWAYFQSNIAEITQLGAGGLDWHGAVVGALLGMALLANMRGVNLFRLLDGLALALPLVAFMAWWGCGAAHCSYGAEVDNLSNYPAVLVWEERDVYNTIAPRYATQPLGMAFSALLLLLVAATTWRRWFEGRRFWFALVLLAMGMFGLGFLRGDYAVRVWELRLDQWLDLGMILSGVVTFLWGSKKRTAMP